MSITQIPATNGAPTTSSGTRDQARTGRRSGSPHESEFDLPPMWHRLWARVIDVSVVGTWVFVLSVAHVFFHLQLWSQTVAPEPWGTWFLATITFAVAYAVYEIVFIWRLGATPGKDLMHIKVVDQHTGANPTFGQAARRWLLPGIVQPIPGAWIGSLLTLGWGATAFTDSQRRTVHDRIAGTRVISKAGPADEDEREERRRQFTFRLVDPFSVYRAARSNPDALRRHPEEHTS
jgi:uncharacterized RDD family membrane protein YckC